MKWIKIEDGAQIPSIREKVICFSSEISHLFICEHIGHGVFEPVHEHLDIVADYEYSDVIINENFSNKSITHWMPLPEPPKTKDQ